MLDKVVAATAGSWWSRGKRKENDNGRKTRGNTGFSPSLASDFFLLRL